MEIEILPFKIQGAEWKLKFCPLKSMGTVKMKFSLFKIQGAPWKKKLDQNMLTKKYHCLTFLL